MPLLQTSTLSNQNIATALLVGTYTATAEKSALMCTVMAAQVAGNGNYTVYATRQLAGAGAAYEYQGRATAFVASGVTSVAFTSLIVPVSNTDVVKVYLVGLAADTTTPDVTCEFWDMLGDVQTLGGGSTTTPITINDGVNPLDGVDVWASTDSGGNNVVARGYTNASGLVTFYLDPATYYIFKTLAGYTFTNPSTLVVT